MKTDYSAPLTWVVGILPDLVLAASYIDGGDGFNLITWF